MKVRYSHAADKQYDALSPSLKRAFDKQLTALVSDIRYPSLRAKKFDEATGLWQARINDSWRFYFLIANDIYFIIGIRDHPK